MNSITNVPNGTTTSAIDLRRLECYAPSRLQARLGDLAEMQAALADERTRIERYLRVAR